MICSCCYYLCIDRVNQLCGQLLYTEWLEAQPEIREALLWTGKGFVGVDCVVVEDYMITWLQTPYFNECLYPPYPNKKLDITNNASNL